VTSCGTPPNKAANQKPTEGSGQPLTDQYGPRGSIIALDDLEHTDHSHEFVGAEHGVVPFCIILVHAQPGVGPKLHRHPYAEVFVVESGQATFRIGDRTVVVDSGHVVVSPPGEAHGFINTGTDELRLTAIHGAGRFSTEWLSGSDPVWSSKPRNLQPEANSRPEP
jgi:mannose-6-phosphate isomerase-like protein (cupin superfamily)